MRIGSLMKRWLTAGVVMATLLVTAACGANGGDQPSSTGSNSLTFAASTPLQWPHVWVATEENLWQEAGLEVDVTLFEDGAQALQSLAGGSVDVATASPTPLVAAVAAGQEIRVIGVTSRWSNWRVVANRSRGIQSPADLRGKRIGVTTGTSGEVSLAKFLADNSLTVQDVELVNVSPPNLASALATGTVDAVATWVPHIVNAEREIGEDAIRFPYEYSANYLLVTTQDVLDRKAESLRALLGVFDRANSIIAQNPDHAAQLITETAGIDAPTLSSIWTQEFTFGVSSPDDPVRAEFQANIEFAKRNGTIPQDTNFPLDDVLVNLTN